MTGWPSGYGENRAFSPRVDELKPLDYEDWDKGPPPSQDAHLRDAPVAGPHAEPARAALHRPFQLYEPGMEVLHRARGRGEVVSVEGDRDEAKVVVRFERRTGLADRERMSVCDPDLRPCGPAPSTRRPPRQSRTQSEVRDRQTRDQASRRSPRKDDGPARERPRREPSKPGRDATRLKQDNSVVLEASAPEQRLAPGSRSVEEFKRLLERGS